MPTAQEIFKLLGVIAVNRAGAVKDLTAVTDTAKKSAKTTSDAFGKSNKDIAKSSADASKSAVSSYDKIGKKAQTIGGALTKYVTLPLLAVGATALKAAEAVDDAYDTIRIGTGATGEALRGLQRDFDAVYEGVTQDSNTTAQVIADLNTRTGQTGESLRALAQAELDLARLTGGDVNQQVRETTRLFESWRIASDQQVTTLDYLFKVSQSTGVGVSDLTNKLVTNGPALRMVHIGFQQAAAMIGQMEKAGVATDGVLGALTISLRKMAQEGKNPVATFRATVQAIKDTGDAGKANALAVELFGRSGVVMAAAIREGRINVDALTRSLQDSGETIERAIGDTDDYREEFAKLWHTVQLLAAEIGKPLMEALIALNPTLKTIAEWIKRLAEGFAGLPQGVKTAILSVGLFAVALGPIVRLVGTLLLRLPALIAGFRGLGAASTITAVRALHTALGAVLTVAGLLALKLWEINDETKKLNQQSQKNNDHTAGMLKQQQQRVAAAYRATGADRMAVRRAIITEHGGMAKMREYPTPSWWASAELAYLRKHYPGKVSNTPYPQKTSVPGFPNLQNGNDGGVNPADLLGGSGGDTKEKPRTVADVRKDMEASIAAAVRMEKARGKDFDLNAAKAGAFNAALQELAAMGGADAEKAMLGIVKRLQTVEAEMEQAGKTTRTVTEIMADYDATMAAATRMKEIRPDFDSNATRADALREAIDALSKSADTNALPKMRELQAELNALDATAKAAADALKAAEKAVADFAALRDSNAYSEDRQAALLVGDPDAGVLLANQAVYNRKIEWEWAQRLLRSAEDRNAAADQLAELTQLTQRAELDYLNAVNASKQAQQDRAKALQQEALTLADILEAQRQANNEYLQRRGTIGTADIIAQEEIRLSEMQQAAVPGSPLNKFYEKEYGKVPTAEDIENQRRLVERLREELLQMRRDAATAIAEQVLQQRAIEAGDDLEAQLRLAQDVLKAKERAHLQAMRNWATAIQEGKSQDYIYALAVKIGDAYTDVVKARQDELVLTKEIEKATERDLQRDKEIAAARRSALDDLRASEQELSDAGLSGGDTLFTRVAAQQQRLARAQQVADRARQEMDFQAAETGEDSPEYLRAKAAWNRAKADILREQDALWQQTGGKFGDALWNAQRDRKAFTNYFRTLFDELQKQQFDKLFKSLFGEGGKLDLGALFGGKGALADETGLLESALPKRDDAPGMKNPFTGELESIPGTGPIAPTRRGKFSLSPNAANALGMAGLLWGGISSTREAAQAGRTEGMLSGAISGAMLGSKLLPGIGTVIGGLAGAIFGGNAARKAEAKRAEEQRQRIEAEMKRVNNGLRMVNDTFERGFATALTNAMTYGGGALHQEYGWAIQDRRGVW